MSDTNSATHTPHPQKFPQVSDSQRVSDTNGSTHTPHPKKFPQVSDSQRVSDTNGVAHTLHPKKFPQVSDSQRVSDTTRRHPPSTRRDAFGPQTLPRSAGLDIKLC